MHDNSINKLPEKSSQAFLSLLSPRPRARRLDQIRRGEAFQEGAIRRRQGWISFVDAALSAPEAREAGRGAQLKDLRSGPG